MIGCLLCMWLLASANLVGSRPVPRRADQLLGYLRLAALQPLSGERLLEALHYRPFHRSPEKGSR